MNENAENGPLAAEFVLGLLDPAAQAQAERRLARDPAFAREVAQWRERFAAFDESAAPLAAPRELWERIERGVDAAPRNAQQRQTRQRTWPQTWPSLWSSLPALRAVSATAAALAAVFAVTTFLSVQFALREAARKPVYIAVLVNDTTQKAGAVVHAFADGRVEMMPLVDIGVPEGRALEIWTLWDSEIGPRSIGLLDRARSVRLNLDQLPMTVENQLFEITLEPATGSPTGRPTGPILFKGTTARAL